MSSNVWEEPMDLWAKAIDEESREGSSKPKKKAKIRILIADDHPIVRGALKTLLAMEEDFDVVGEAADGREVLEQVRDLDPDILMLDLRMPHLDGLATLQALRQKSEDPCDRSHRFGKQERVCASDEAGMQWNYA